MLQGNMRYLFDPICKFYNIIQSSIGTQYYHVTNKEEYQLLKRNKSLYRLGADRRGHHAFKLRERRSARR